MGWQFTCLTILVVEVNLNSTRFIKHEHKGLDMPTHNLIFQAVLEIVTLHFSISLKCEHVSIVQVIYIGVTDYLQKREKEKFEKEEAEKAKRGSKKKRARPRVGPKGFGQKIDNDDDL